MDRERGLTTVFRKTIRTGDTCGSLTLLFVFTFLTSMILSFSSWAMAADAKGKPVAKQQRKPETVWQATPAQRPGPEGAMQRTVAFTGDPIIVNARVNRGTLMRLPGEPILIQMGRPEDFSVEVNADMKYVMIKPLTAMSASNVFITTKSGLYLFFFYAEDEPTDFKKTRKPFDMVVTVTDPYKQNRIDDVQSLVWMAFHGRKMDDMTLVQDVMTSPGASVYVQDTVVGIGMKATLMRVHFFPQSSLVTYWVRFENVKTAKLNLRSHDQTYALDEKTFRTPGLMKVAVANIGGRSVPLMGVGDKLDAFLVVKTNSVPPVLKLRFALQGSRTLPMEATFPTRGATYKNMDKARSDERIRKLLEDVNTVQPSGPQESLPETNDYVIDDTGNGTNVGNIYSTPSGSVMPELGATGTPRVVPDRRPTPESGQDDEIVFD